MERGKLITTRLGGLALSCYNVIDNDYLCGGHFENDDGDDDDDDGSKMKKIIRLISDGQSIDHQYFDRFRCGHAHTLATFRFVGTPHLSRGLNVLQWARME